MTIRRTFDPAFLTAVANDADVRPWLGGDGELDLTNDIRNPANIALVTDHGGWVLVRQDVDSYELHTMFLRSGRGRLYFEAAQAALDYVFVRTDAREIVTKVPLLNQGADMASTRCGFVERFSRENAWDGPQGVCDISYRSLTLDRWCGIADVPMCAGEAFHDQIETHKKTISSTLPDHPADPAHDRAAGASYLMIRAGNVRKGIWFYNRWASLAGYSPIVLLSETPTIIDVGSGVVIEAHEGRMEILQCP